MCVCMQLQPISKLVCLVPSVGMISPSAVYSGLDKEKLKLRKKYC